MKIFWAKAAAGAIGGFLFQHLLGKSMKSVDMPELEIHKPFFPHPMPVYRELIVHALTKDFNPKRMVAVRNFLGRNPNLVDEAYASAMPPETAAREIDILLDSV